MKNWIRKKLRAFLGIDDIADNVHAISCDIYDIDAMLNGYRFPKVQYRDTIPWAGKEKKVR